MIPHTIVLVCERFSEQLSAERVAEAIARGLRAASPYDVVCEARRDPEVPPREHADTAEREAFWDGLALHEARALVIADPDFCGGEQPRAATFELATRARQGGVPAYAVSAVPSPDLFQARMLDLQVVLLAHGERSLERAGERLAELV